MVTMAANITSLVSVLTDHSERNVTVLLDGEESTIEFIDPANRNVSSLLAKIIVLFNYKVSS